MVGVLFLQQNTPKKYLIRYLFDKAKKKWYILGIIFLKIIRTKIMA